MGSARTSLIIRLAVGLACLSLSACGPNTGAAGASSGAARVGGPFQLLDQNGRPADQSLLKGRWSAVFFGYTFCPDVCPTTLQVLAQAQALLQAKGQTLQVVFITIDPQRDTAAHIKTYLSSPAFPKGTIGLTGAPAQIASAAKAYRVYYQKVGADQAYSVDHSTVIYLMNPRGELDRPILQFQDPAAIADQIWQAVQAAAKGAA